MRGYIKYIVLFVILIIVGIVSVNLYNNDKLDSGFKKKEKTEEKKKEEDKDKDKEEKKEEEKVKEEVKDNKEGAEEETQKDVNVDNSSDNGSVNTEQVPTPKGYLNQSAVNSNSSSNDTIIQNRVIGETDEYIIIEVDPRVYNY